MGFYDIWPFFVGIGLMLGFAATPLFRPLRPPVVAAGSRRDAIDGLRGLLALSVFFNHAAIYHAYLRSGVWELPPSHFYALLGQVGVALFFIITGYLFWGKILQDAGRPDLVRLYVGRVFRIGPLYLVAVAVLFALVFCRTGLQLHQSVPALAKAAVKWGCLGMFGGGPDINGDSRTNALTAGVTWTLRYEWAFYISLSLTGVLGRLRAGQVALCGGVLAVCLGYVAWRVPADAPAPHAVWISLFLAGMLAAAVERCGRVPRLPAHGGSMLALLLIGLVFLCCASVKAVLPPLLLGGAFFLVARGADLFGLLTCTAARRLGDVSYGIYLLQGLVLAVIFSAPSLRRFALASPSQHWLVMFGAAAGLVSVAGVLHVAIERPGVALGRYIVGRVRRPPAPERSGARGPRLAIPPGPHTA